MHPWLVWSWQIEIHGNPYFGTFRAGRCTSSLVQRWLRYSWGQWCFALLMQNMWIYCGAGFDLRVLETLTVVEQLFYCTVCTIFPLWTVVTRLFYIRRNVSCQNKSTSDTLLWNLFVVLFLSNTWRGIQTNTVLFHWHTRSNLYLSPSVQVGQNTHSKAQGIIHFCLPTQNLGNPCFLPPWGM